MSVVRKSLKPFARRVLLADARQVYAIESEAMQFPRSLNTINQSLQARGILTIGVDVADELAAFNCYELRDRSFYVKAFAVMPKYQRCGLGTALVVRLKELLTPIDRFAIHLMVNESNLDAQLFFKSCGFQAIAVKKNYFDDGSDAYHFRYAIRRGGNS